MRTVILAGLALGAAALSVPATAAGESAGTSARGHMTGVQYAPPPARPTATHRTEGKVHGRWHAATQAPGGWRSYRRPVSGFTLPRYWIQPTFYIANYPAYGLSVPPSGYGWSRYYDDAVLTDRYGRVYDYRSDIDWNRSGRDHDGPVYRDAPPPRLPSYDYGSYRDDGVTYSNEDGRNEYQGTWTGTWTGEDGRTYSGTYTGAFNGDVYGEDVPPHWDDMPPPPEAMPLRPYPGGYYSQGYYYPAPTVTTVIIQPGVSTTTTTYTEEYVTPSRRKWGSKTR